MKTKLLFTSLFSLFIIGNSFAQNFKYGALAGLDISSNQITNADLRTENNTIYSPSISFNINAYIGYKSQSFWGISIEPGFIKKVGVDKNETAIINDDIHLQLNYIQMPILFDIYLNDKIYFSCGPEIGYLLNGKTKSISSVGFDIWDTYSRKIELSGLIGLNYCLSNHFDVGIRYNHDMTYISKVIDFNSNRTSNEYNQYLQLMLRFKL